jgi:hypothetical protein
MSVKPTELGEPMHLGATTEMEAVYEVAQFVETLRYKLECCGFDSR